MFRSEGDALEPLYASAFFWPRCHQPLECDKLCPNIPPSYLPRCSMDRVSKDGTLDVPDSTDWLETPLRSLANVDSALRCQVCRDFYTTPMITSCSHTFCSLCIRRSLNNDGKCPACRAPEQEMKLRNNNAMEDLVDAFKRARPDVLEFARKPASTPATLPPKRNFEQTEPDMEESSQKRRRSERTRPSSQRVAPMPDDSDDDYIPGGLKDEENFHRVLSLITDNGLVKCPICGKRVKEGIINKHIDEGCPDEPQIKVTKPLDGRPSRGFDRSPPPFEEIPKRPERLAQLNYSMIKENPLRKKLTDAGLSAAGNRPLLERRYTEWITLWNANCDAAKPKSKGELKRELDIWEKTQGGRVMVSSASQIGAQIRDKEFDGKAWSNKHDSDFQQLIANAKRKVKVQSTPTPSESNETATPDGGPVVDIPDEVLTGTPQSDPIAIGDTPEESSKSRFFEDNHSEPPPSSQYQDRLDELDKNTEILSDVATIKQMQP